MNHPSATRGGWEGGGGGGGSGEQSEARDYDSGIYACVFFTQRAAR